MELDHAIAKTLKGEGLKEALAEQNLADDYNLEGTENLVPACGRPCNRRKRAQKLPTTGAVSAVLERARELAPTIEREATTYRTVNKLSEAVAIISSVDEEHLVRMDDSERKALRRAASLLAFAVDANPVDVRVHGAIDPHDYIPPETRDAEDIIDRDEFLGLLQDWTHHAEATANETLQSNWGDARQQLRTAWPTSVERLEYSDELNRFLARVIFSIEYMYYDDDGTGGPADIEDVFDLWTTLDGDRDQVLDVGVDLAGTFPD